MNAFSRIYQALGVKLFAIGGKPVSLATVLIALFVVLTTIWISRVMRIALRRSLAHRGVREGSAAAIGRLIHYLLLIVGFTVALQTLGVDLGALFAAGAIFAVALGFAMQNIVQNFVSGVILLVEQSIKPGDILGIENQVVRVLGMRIRSTIVQTRDGEDLVVPNSVLVQSTVKNFTLKDSLFRVRATVGVTYGSDMALVEQTLMRVARDIPWRLSDHEPQILLLGFGDNSVNWEVAVWVGDPWRARVHLSQLTRAIWDAFQQEKIVIAFPQLDVHFDPPVTDGLARLARG